MRILDDVLNWARKKACVHLHIPHMEIWYTLEFYDQYGNLIKKRHERSKSWVRNAYNVFLNSLSGAANVGDIAVKDTAGSSNTIDHGLSNVRTYQSPAQSVAYGIVLGRGADAESFDSHAVSTVIGAGNSTNQLFSPTGDARSVSYNSGTKVYTTTWSRVFNNNSEASISLTNIGLIAYLGLRYSPETNWNVLMSRDVISPSETIIDKAQVRVTYQISLTFPA